jgi:hypothetical protein
MSIFHPSIFLRLSILVALYICGFMGLMYVYHQSFGNNLQYAIVLFLFIQFVLDMIRKRVNENFAFTLTAFINANLDMLITCILGAYSISLMDSDKTSHFIVFVVFAIFAIGSTFTVLRNFFPLFREKYSLDLQSKD